MKVNQFVPLPNFLQLLSVSAGFLRTKAASDKSESSAENLGIKDIAAALRWIKINIAAFGGDPTRVTIVGHDTGAALVNLLFVSPNSKGGYFDIVFSNYSKFFYRIV